MGIEIKEYHGYRSNTSKWKAMCVTIGEYKLYFSYNILIAFETPNKCYKIDDHWSFTTKQHRSSAGRYGKPSKFVNPKILNLLVYTELERKPFKEAMSLAGVHCERVH